MRHGHHTSPVVDSWLIAVIIVGLVAVITGILWLVHRRTIASDGLSPLERKRLAPEEREILSMLRQNGGPMVQRDIVEMLPGDIGDLAEIMRSMEEKGLICRTWKPDQSTYVVSTRAEDMGNENGC